MITVLSERMEQENNAVRIAEDGKGYVIPACGGSHYSYCSFDYCFNQVWLLCEKLKLPAPREDLRGTMTCYARYQELLGQIGDRDLGTWYDRNTPQVVRDVLELVRMKHQSVRLWYGDPVTGCSWLDEFEMVGCVSRSTGALKVPILVPRGDDGGAAILDACVIRIQRTHGAQMGEVLYSHPKFHLPPWELVKGATPEYPFAVRLEGGEIAAFSTEEKRRNWCEFMKGERVRS